MAKAEMFGIFPLTGILIPPEDLKPSVLNLPWTVVTGEEVDWGIIPDVSESFKSNLTAARDRLGASAFLIVRHYISDPSEAKELSRLAERIVSGLNFGSLLSFSTPLQVIDGKDRRFASPISLATRTEYSTQFTIDRDKLRQVGGFVQALAWSNTIALSYTTTEVIEAGLSTCPKFVNDLINGTAPPFIEASARAFNEAFDARSIGQFVAQALTSLDILFGENDSKRWSELKSYAVTLCGDQSRRGVDELFDARHKFIHRNVQPDLMSLHFLAVAVVTAVFVRFNFLLEKYGSLSKAQNIIKAADYLRRAAADATSPQINSTADDLLQFLPLPDWITGWFDYPAVNYLTGEPEPPPPLKLRWDPVD